MNHKIVLSVDEPDTTSFTTLGSTHVTACQGYKYTHVTLHYLVRWYTAGLGLNRKMTRTISCFLVDYFNIVISVNSA